MGVRGRVAFLVLAVSAVVFSALGTVGFLRIAHDGRVAVRERVDDVLDDLAAAVRAGTGTTDLTTADGVVASVWPANASGAPQPSNRLVVVRRSVQVGGVPATLVGSASSARVGDGLRSLHRSLWMAIPMAAVVSAALAWAATAAALRPVQEITNLASEIDDRSGSRRVPVPRTGDEIEQLARTVNEMLDRIDAGRAAQRRFVADAAHELRTPLMAMRGEVHLLADRTSAHRLDAVVDRLARRVEDLLLLARLDDAPAVPTPARDEVDLFALAADEAAIVAPNARVHGEPVSVRGDRELLARAVRNLVANAQRHASSTVEVLVEVRGERAWVHVDDDGEGIAAEHRRTVLERFVRLDEARSRDRGGSGLGLSIVDAIARSHDGEVRIDTSPLGGARVSVSLPLGDATSGGRPAGPRYADGPLRGHVEVAK